MNYTPEEVAKLLANRPNQPHYIASLIAECVAAERERCAMELQVTRADVQLAAGELSADEWRMCAAVLRWMQVRIRGVNVANDRA